MEQVVHEILRYAYKQCATDEMTAVDPEFTRLISDERRASRWCATAPHESETQTIYFVPRNPQCFVNVLASRLIRPLADTMPKSTLSSPLSRIECAYRIDKRTELLRLAFPVGNRLAVALNDNFIGNIPTIPLQDAMCARVPEGIPTIMSAGTLVYFIGLGGIGLAMGAML